MRSVLLLLTLSLAGCAGSLAGNDAHISHESPHFDGLIFA
jgi:hypothetical protein